MARRLSSLKKDGFFYRNHGRLDKDAMEDAVKIKRQPDRNDIPWVVDVVAENRAGFDMNRHASCNATFIRNGCDSNCCSGEVDSH